MAADLDDIQLGRLARELVMNIRNYKDTFALFGIDENDYQQIEKNEFFRKVKEQFTLEWNSTLSTEERIRFQNLAYYEQLSPILTRRAMQPDANLSASTDVAKILMKGAGIGEAKSEKANSERFVITINLGADTEGKEVIEHYDKPIAVDPDPDAIAADAKLSAEIKAKTRAITGDNNGPTVDAEPEEPALEFIRAARERQRP
jgi:hypothetical protein